MTELDRVGSEPVRPAAGSLRAFDDYLNEQLEDCARDAGEDVYTYVARAVAAQMVADRSRVDGVDIETLVSRLADAGVFTETQPIRASLAIANPERLQALHATGLLDTPAEEAYDRITRAAADALHTPFAAISLIDADRQFLKSTVGPARLREQASQTPLERSMCQYVVAHNAVVAIEDARVDPVYRNHPAVKDGSLTSYIGIPLADPEGHAIGALCVFDTQPRTWSSGHVQILNDLGAVVGARIFGPGNTRR